MNPQDLDFNIYPIAQVDQTSELPVSEYVKDGDTKRIGLIFMTQLCVSMNQLDIPCPSIVAISESEVLIGSLNQDTHEERADACRWYGRYIRQEFKSPCLYLLSSIAAWVGGDEDGCAPKDSPTRKEQAITLLRDMSPLHKADGHQSHMDAMTEVSDLVWMVNFHEGMPGDVIYDGARSWQGHQTDPERECLIQSNLFPEVMIGIGDHFPGIKAIMENKEEQDKHLADVVAYEKEHNLPHEPAPWETEEVTT